MKNGHTPKVANFKQYDAYLRQGMSKRKAARLANESSNENLKNFGLVSDESPHYEDWTKQELMNKAAEMKIVGRSRMNKVDLIDAIRHH